MDIPNSTSPPNNPSIDCITDSVRMKEFAALLCAADGIEKLEAQVKKTRKKTSSPAFKRIQTSLEIAICNF